MPIRWKDVSLLLYGAMVRASTSLCKANDLLSVRDGAEGIWYNFLERGALDGWDSMGRALYMRSS